MFKDQLILELRSFDAYNEEVRTPTPKVHIDMVHDQLTSDSKYCAKHIAYTMGLGTPCNRHDCCKV